MSQIIKSVLCNLAVIQVLPFLNNPKDLDPSYKMDLDFWDCFGRKKTLSYKRRNMVLFLYKFEIVLAHPDMEVQLKMNYWTKYC